MPIGLSDGYWALVGHSSLLPGHDLDAIVIFKGLLHFVNGPFQASAALSYHHYLPQFKEYSAAPVQYPAHGGIPEPSFSSYEDIFGPTGAPAGSFGPDNHQYAIGASARRSVTEVSFDVAPTAAGENTSHGGESPAQSSTVRDSHSYFSYICNLFCKSTLPDISKFRYPTWTRLA